MALAKKAAQIIASLFKNKYVVPKKSFSEYSEHDEDKEDTQVQEKVNLELASAIINGGASGIGYAIAKEFLKKGLQQLTIVDKDLDKGENALKTLTKEFGEDKVLFFEADVSNSKELDDVYRKSIQFHDTPEIVVNSAGMINDLKWEDQLKTNITGCVIGTLLGLQYMSKSSNGEGGIIVNIGSILGIIPSSGYPLHTMTQFAVCGFTKALGCGNHITRTGVRIFGLCPGLTTSSSLSNAPRNTINERFAQEFADEIEGSTPQKPETVAKGLIDILDDAKPGSVWVVENDGSPYEVTYPGKVLEYKRDKDVPTNQDFTAYRKN